YYRRTISRSRNGSREHGISSEVRASAPAVPNAVAAASPHDSSATDPNIKAKLCDELSSILGVSMLRILKITGAEPSYLMELASGSIEFPDTGKLLSQTFVKNALAGRAGKVIRRFGPLEWERVTQMLIDACTEMEALMIWSSRGEDGCTSTNTSWTA